MSHRLQTNPERDEHNNRDEVLHASRRLHLLVCSQVDRREAECSAKVCWWRPAKLHNLIDYNMQAGSG